MYVGLWVVRIAPNPRKVVSITAWIESHQTLVRHPKTMRLARSLGVSVPTAIGHLHCLWWWALEYAQDGELTEFEPEDIASASLWEGDAQAFVSALIESCFLDHADTALYIHDWHDYAGKLIEKRKSDAERKRQSRTSDQRPTDIQRTSNGHPRDGAGNRNHDPNLTMVHENPPIIPPKIRKPFRSRKQQDQFDQFWQRYPKKKSKGQAEKAWAKINPDEQLHEAILNGLERAKTAGDWQKNNGEFIPHPATWLNAKGWEDEEGGSDNGTADDVTSEWITLEARRNKSSDFE